MNHELQQDIGFAVLLFILIVMTAAFMFTSGFALWYVLHGTLSMEPSFICLMLLVASVRYLK